MAVALYVWIILAVLVVLVLASMATIRIEISLKIENGHNEAFMIVHALGGIVRKKIFINTKPGVDRTSLSGSGEPSSQGETAISAEIVSLIREVLVKARQNAPYFKILRGKARVEDFEVRARLGIGDAAHTALLCGSLISLLHIALSYLQNRYYFEKKRVDITPVFDREIFRLHFNCIIALKLRYIIIAGMQKTAEKIKGGEGIVRASD